MDGSRREVVGLPRPRRSDDPAVTPEPAGSPAVVSEPAGSPAVNDSTQAQAVPGAELTERERDILDFERQWWKHAGAKEQAIRDRFGLSATRYYQVLNGLLDRQAALAYDPVLVKRLRRLRATRSRARRGGRGSTTA